MQSPLVNDDVWTRRGISLLWDADELNKLCEPKQIISLRRFRQLHAAGWSDVDSCMVNDALIVGGLESVIDALPPEEMTQWLEQHIYQALVSYQREVAYGGTEASLIFWITEHSRLYYQTSNDAWMWHCAGEHRKELIPLGRCLFNGVEPEVKAIENEKGIKKGLFLVRISC